MMNKAKIWPTAAESLNHALNAIRLMLTELSISSIDIKTNTAFLRASTPYTPTLKRKAPSVRTQARLTVSPPQSFFARTIAPTNAARSKTETTSNGRM